MHFVFDQIYEKFSYSRNDISAVVQGIVDDFARRSLFQTLRNTYQEMIKLSKQSCPSQQPQAKATGWDEFEKRFREDKSQSYEEFLWPTAVRKVAE